MIAIVLGVLEACSSDGDSALPSADGGGPIPEASYAGDAWGASSCASCVKKACVEETTRCRSEPTCARKLDCVDSCPTSATGELDRACADACPAPAGSAATTAFLDFEQCRTGGLGVRCEHCGVSVDEFSHPLLTQYCPDPSYDAGPDATPVQERCTKCGTQTCCGSRSRCLQDKECAALRSCAMDCSNDAGAGDFTTCYQHCIDMHDGALGMYSELLDCVSIRCPGPCEITPDPCTHCLFTTCADEWIDCAADNDCNHLFRCYGDCKNDACRNACVPPHQKGQEKLGRILLCTQNNCPACL